MSVSTWGGRPVARWFRRHLWTASVALLAVVLVVEAITTLVLVGFGVDPSAVVPVLNGVSAPFVLLVIVMSVARISRGVVRFAEGDAEHAPGPMVIDALTARKRDAPDDRWR